MLPSDESFHRGDLSAAEVDFGLVVQNEGVSFDRVTQVHFHVASQFALCSHRFGEVSDVVGTADLRDERSLVCAP
ncbi:hypothetical protein E5720_08055 [Rhodococcus sp. PAMC28707]|uniref:hypothetical protein n=1 Tax=unclassified Rhodococcus (in: high G+C Gram-positive bacteria) TaxID=192944 RepID=UPI00109E058C|nr:MULTISPECIES: hypothetical protein [unclassified Rhodococcus (in: high G+C Gram-positive bacteria)]QCB49838.1 hypothetical protein E5769_05960 [Rhodococcus sp. PAMC28705]QCB58469.1 hypothetical protein E5720_08055 [Rhodococcus sp. PAMC28707]